MEDMTQKVERLRRTGAEAQARHAGAVAGAEHAETLERLVLEEMTAEFGASSLEEADALLARLRAQVEAEAARVEEELMQTAGEAR